MGFRVEHRLGVPASALDVWTVLADIEAWPQWTPLYPSVKGALRIGGTIQVTEQVEGFPPRDLEPRIGDWEPEAQILWTLKQASGFLTRTRYIEIEKLAETGCIVSNGELFDGLASRYITRAHRRARYLAYVAFGEALSAKVLSGR